MPRSIDRRVSSGWLGLVAVLAAGLGGLGCPGTLDPALLSASGAGGSSGAGGTGGSGCDGAALVMTTCAKVTCHTTASKEAGLDLTPNATVGARLIGVMSAGTSPDSVCGGVTEPYLQAGSNPPTGLFIDKITEQSPPCGSPMPFDTGLLSTDQQSCIEQWAEGLIMAAQ